MRSRVTRVTGFLSANFQLTMPFRSRLTFSVGQTDWQTRPSMLNGPKLWAWGIIISMETVGFRWRFPVEIKYCTKFENVLTSRDRRKAAARMLDATTSSADADKPVQRVYRSVKVTKHSTIPYVTYSVLLCNSKFVFKTRRFSLSIFHFKKCRDLEIRVRGPSRSLEILPLDTARMTSLCSTGYQLW